MNNTTIKGQSLAVWEAILDETVKREITEITSGEIRYVISAFKELIEKHSILERDFEQYSKESVKWNIHDFTSYDGYTISEEKAQEALEVMIDSHDANNGITWTTIEYYLDIYGEKIEE